MRLLQPDPHPTRTLPVCSLDFYGECVCFFSHSPRWRQQLNDPLAHHLMARSLFPRHDMYSAISRCRCT